MTGSPSLGEEHLVEVGEPEPRDRRPPTRPARPRSWSARARLVGPGVRDQRLTAPGPRAGPIATAGRGTASPRRWSGRSSPVGAVRCPSLDGVLVALVQQQPLLLAVRRSSSVPRGRTSRGALAVEVGVQLPRRDRLAGSPSSPAPRAPSPARSRRRRRTRPGDHTSKSAYSRGWSSTWIAIRRAFGSRTGPGYRPAHQHAVDLEPQVVVQPAGRCVDDEAARAGRTRPVARSCPTAPGSGPSRAWDRYVSSGSAMPHGSPARGAHATHASRSSCRGNGVGEGRPDRRRTTRRRGGPDERAAGKAWTRRAGAGAPRRECRQHRRHRGP